MLHSNIRVHDNTLTPWQNVEVKINYILIVSLHEFCKHHEKPCQWYKKWHQLFKWCQHSYTYCRVNYVKTIYYVITALCSRFTLITTKQTIPSSATDNKYVKFGLSLIVTQSYKLQTVYQIFTWSLAWGPIVSVFFVLYIYASRKQKLAKNFMPTFITSS